MTLLKFLGSYVGLEILIVAVGVLSTLWIRRRRLKGNSHVPPGFVMTEETFIDPTTGIQQRVWFNPKTGERFYQTPSDVR